MPPFTRLAALIVESPKEALAAAYAKQLARSAPRLQGVEVIGPAPAPLYMLRGCYRQRLLARAERHINLQQVVMRWVEAGKPPAQVRLKIDIDPYGFL
jgi:primosomal protein N' (replication factor Y)